MIYMVIFAGMYALSLMMKMHWLTAVGLTLYLLLTLKQHRRLFDKMHEETKRFGDAAGYLDTFLYAFVREEKVERTLENVEAALEEGTLRQKVKDAIDHLHMTFDESDVMRESLRIVEKAYPCSRIATVHDFAVHVECYGGAIEHPIRLLLADKNRWENRIRLSMKERKKMFSDIIMSIGASLVICGVILYLPVMDMDISGNILSQILTAIVVILDERILLQAQKYMAVDWLSLEINDEKEDEAKIRSFYNYNEKKDRRLSMILTVLSLAATAVAFFFGKKAFGAIGLLLCVLMANQHRLGRSLARKNIIKRIRCVFPGWLLDLVLLLQSENVQVSLNKSKEHAPKILSQDLNILTDRLLMEPESAEPYHDFLKEFHIPQVHSAMSMLFSISMGNSSHGDQQMGELISRNLEMLDAAETERLKNLCSGMYLLFLAPVVTASLKLVVDMAVFMLTFIGGAGLGGL
ncbi:MAG: hypothetical protein MR508_00420 [Lachnospiraceae bacterium]|nr:hypothetical protein [Lachnospiraceae bacterium]